jgi:hypothetical protein
MMTTTTTTHTYFSASWAQTHGSAVYRKLDGAAINVTRTNMHKDGRERHPWDERYVGEVVCAQEGGCIHSATLAAAPSDAAEGL